MSGLEGKWVVVTRPREQAATLSSALLARGAMPILFPTITTRAADDPAPVDAAVERLDRYAWIVFTSANAVRFFGDRLAGRRRALPTGVKVAAVGPATAKALADRDIPVDVMPQEFRGERLAESLGDLEGQAVLLPRADIGREETVESLRAAGAVVDDITVYHTVPATPDPDGRRALEAGVDAVTFTSPSTVRNYFRLLGSGAAGTLDDTVIACLGPVTAEAVIASGLPVHVQPAVYTIDALVEALDAYFAARAEPAGRAP